MNIPDNFKDLCEMYPIGPILNKQHYERVMKLTKQLALLSIKNEEQLDYFDKIIDHIVEYENKVSNF